MRLVRSNPIKYVDPILDLNPEPKQITDPVETQDEENTENVFHQI